MDAKIKELLIRLSFFAEDGMADKPIVEIAKQADALLLEVARKQNTQQPVAWVWQFPDGERYEDPFGTKSECEQNCAGYDGQAIPLYPAPPAPRDVLMAFGEAVREQTLETAWQIGKGKLRSAVDLAAIADRYASKVRQEPIAPDVIDALVGNDGGRKQQPEPVNQQLLAALKRLLHKAYKQNWQDNYPSEVECAEAAIASAEAAQPYHIVDADKMVQAEPVARIKTVGGYPDDSRHELELLVKHGQLSDGQLLYAHPPAVAVPYASLRSRVADLIHLLQFFGMDAVSDADKSQALSAMDDIRAMLSAAQKQEGV